MLRARLGGEACVKISYLKLISSIRSILVVTRSYCVPLDLIESTVGDSIYRCNSLLLSNDVHCGVELKSLP